MPRAVILLADNDLSRAYHALVLAVSARAMGYEVHLFATGLGGLVFSRRPRTRLLGLPRLARWFVERRMRRVGARGLEELAREVLEAGVKVYLDEPVARMLGVEPIEGVEYGGALTFLALAREADLLLTF